MQSTAADQAQFRTSLRSFLDQRSDEQQVRRLLDDPIGYDPEVWRLLSDDLGVPSMLVPEDLGGQGLSPVEAAIAVGEAARALLGAPVTSAAIAAAALLRADDRTAAGPLLQAIATGEKVVAVAGATGLGSVVATRSGDSVTLSGDLPAVVDGPIADVVLVPVTADSTVSLYAVAFDASGVSRRPLAVLDGTRRQAAVGFDRAEATLVAADFTDGWAYTQDFAATMAAAELFAVAERCLEIAVDYAKEREQFGRPIGSFQAVKHMLAEAMAAVEQMRAGVGFAAEAVAGDDPAERADCVSVVKAFCSTEGPKVAQTLIQTLGGMGYTWEHVAHLYLRRARTTEMLWGDSAWHRARLARQLALVGT
jgi:alkylation response protein AidB-like acyl-CoA dehydrogenase